jgi:hypothetical protein
MRKVSTHNRQSSTVDLPSTAATPEGDSPPSGPAGGDGRVLGIAGDGDAKASGLVINPFDPARIRIGVGYGELAATKAANPTFPVWNSPPKTAWFMVHPEYEVDIYMLDQTDEDRDALYYVERSIAEGLPTESTISPRLLALCQTTQGDDFLWAIKLKRPLDKKANSWTTSALQEKELGRTRWIRHQTNRRKGCYEPLISDAITIVPRWSELPPFPEILRIALKDRYIDSLDHEVLVELRKGGKRS